MHVKKNSIVWSIAIAFCAAPFFVHAVTVGPVKLEYSANPGDVIRGEMIVQNEGASQQTFFPSFERFTEENGEKKFSIEKSNLSTWFSMQDRVDLKPSEQKTIPFIITVPENAEPGGHYAVIWWSTASPASNSGAKQQVSIVTRAGVLVYVRIAGDIKEEGSVSAFYINGSKNFFQTKPFRFSLLFQNSGNVHIKPVGVIKAKNIFGAERGIIPINPYGLQILPQTQKSLEAEWKDEKKNPFGLYKISYSATFGDPQKEVSGSRWIFIFSWGPIIWIVIIIAILIFLPKAIRTYNSWILRKARIN